MRKRKWWFAGLALALLAACVGLWKWREQPPFAFLKGADLYFVEALGPSGDGDYDLQYTTAKPTEEVFAEALREAPGSWKGQVNGSTVLEETQRAGITSIAIARCDPKLASALNAHWGDSKPSVGRDVRTLIWIRRKPTTLDRVRAWIHSLPPKGGVP